MKYIKYSSEKEVNEAYKNYADKKCSDIWNNGISVSFNYYNEIGNTLEFHVYYF